MNGGKGRIYGLEVLAKLNPRGKAFGFASYTLSRSERDDYGTEWRLFDYDQTHILTLPGGYKFGRGWDFGSTFRLVSGTRGRRSSAASTTPTATTTTRSTAP